MVLLGIVADCKCNERWDKNIKGAPVRFESSGATTSVAILATLFLCLLPTQILMGERLLTHLFLCVFLFELGDFCFHRFY